MSDMCLTCSDSVFRFCYLVAVSKNVLSVLIGVDKIDSCRGVNGPCKSLR